MRALSTAALAALLAAWAGAAAAVTPISGFSQAQTHVFAAGGSSSDTDQLADQWTGTPQALTVFVQSTVQHASGPILSALSATAINRADWSADGASGSVDLDWNWRVSALGDPDPDLRGASFDGLNPNWSYTFRADGDGLFRWEGQIRADPTLVGNNPFGLSGWNLQLNGVTVIDLFDPTGGSGPRTGDADFAIVAGQTYTFSLVNASNIAGTNFAPDYRGGMLGDFFWDIVEAPTTPVPEPGAWALILAGFGLVGTSVRARRRAVRTARR